MAISSTIIDLGKKSGDYHSRGVLERITIPFGDIPAGLDFITRTRLAGWSNVVIVIDNQTDDTLTLYMIGAWTPEDLGLSSSETSWNPTYYAGPILAGYRSLVRAFSVTGSIDASNSAPPCCDAVLYGAGSASSGNLIIDVYRW